VSSKRFDTRLRRQKMTTNTRFTVKLTEIDRMGIVHHSNYPIWFETARRDFLKEAGAPSSKIRALGLFLPLSELKCEFKSPAKYNDEINVATNLIYMSCVKIKFEYKVFNNINEKIIATGKTVHAWTNMKIEPINIEKAAPEIYGLLRQFVLSTGINEKINGTP
jgi:acyl-CoA thioester hydrolase